MGYDAELIEARATLRLSGETAAGFLKQLGALTPILIFPFPGATLGKRPGFQLTVMDHKYWFAKLYELVSYQEISYALTTAYPGFTLHFHESILYDVLQRAPELHEEKLEPVSPLWSTSFTGPPADSHGDLPEPDSMEAIKFCVRTRARLRTFKAICPHALVAGC